MRTINGCRALCAGLLLSGVCAISVNLDDQSSINAAAKILANGVLSYYNASVPGLPPAPYYWWEGGATWNALIKYWSVTGDASYNAMIEEAMLFQIGPDRNYMPPNQSTFEGNDDQSIWALAAMTALEENFPTPSSSDVTWLELARNVFNDQAARWDTSTCGGGLRWQIYPFNAGYSYKNAVSSGYFMQLAARLALYTGNQTYADWAIKAYSWSEEIGLVSNGRYAVYDGTSVTMNCTTINRLQWSNNAATFVYGSAVMYNLTNGSPEWLTRTQGLLDATSIFFNNNSVMYELACEQSATCNNDQLAFKALTSHWLGATASVAPFTYEYIHPRIRASAQAAAAACSGSTSGTACGGTWTTGSYNGMTGLSQELSALEVLLANVATPSGGSSSAISGSSTARVSSAGTSSVSNTASASITSPTLVPVAPTPTVSSTAISVTAASTTTGLLATYTGAGVRLTGPKEVGLAALAVVAYHLV